MAERAAEALVEKAREQVFRDAIDLRDAVARMVEEQSKTGREFAALAHQTAQRIREIRDAANAIVNAWEGALEWAAHNGVDVRKLEVPTLEAPTPQEAVP
jgi:hypothetical protein